MISMNEVCKDIDSVPAEHKVNLEALLIKLNQLRTAWNHPMNVTSGYRTMADHLRIYKEKGITDTSKIPMKSKHLSGHACDFADDGLVFTAWLKAHPEVLEQIGLWCEEGNKNWVHVQDIPPSSGKRWFLP